VKRFLRREELNDKKGGIVCILLFSCSRSDVMITTNQTRRLALDGVEDTLKIQSAKNETNGLISATRLFDLTLIIPTLETHNAHQEKQSCPLTHRSQPKQCRSSVKFFGEMHLVDPIMISVPVEFITSLAERSSE
jgi:hypothetical protein